MHPAVVVAVIVGAYAAAIVGMIILGMRRADRAEVERQHLRRMARAAEFIDNELPPGNGRAKVPSIPAAQPPPLPRRKGGAA